jgi:hypothetical protein
VLDGVGQQAEELLVSTEVGEVLEGQVDGADQSAGLAQLEELVALALASGHAKTIRPGADPALAHR